MFPPKAIILWMASIRFGMLQNVKARTDVYGYALLKVEHDRKELKKNADDGGGVSNIHNRRRIVRLLGRKQATPECLPISCCA